MDTFPRLTTIFLVCCCIELVKPRQYYEDLLIAFGSDECSGYHRKDVVFKEDRAINFTSHNLGDYYYYEQHMLCKYRIQPLNQHRGVFATIQDLSLHTKEDQCFSYVEFVSIEGKKSKKFCGKLNAEDIMNVNPQTFDTVSHNNTFINTYGAMDIIVFIPKEVLNENISINIIFTLYDYCVLAPEYSKQCLEAREYCIHEDFFNDGVINCPFFGCVDEGGCVKVHSNRQYMYIMGGFISICILIVAVCWFIWRKNMLCCSKLNTSTNNPSEPHVAISPRQHVVLNESETVLWNRSVDEVFDKDLPPSYESLFPRRT